MDSQQQNIDNIVSLINKYISYTSTNIEYSRTSLETYNNTSKLMSKCKDHKETEDKKIVKEIEDLMNTKIKLRDQLQELLDHYKTLPENEQVDYLMSALTKCTTELSI